MPVVATPSLAGLGAILRTVAATASERSLPWPVRGVTIWWRSAILPASILATAILVPPISTATVGSVVAVTDGLRGHIDDAAPCRVGLEDSGNQGIDNKKLADLGGKGAAGERRLGPGGDEGDVAQ